MHGLHETNDDPFVDLLSLEQDLVRAGRVVLRFDWPSEFSPRWAPREIIDPNRSLSGALAPHLDSFLRRAVAGSYQTGEWIVVAHSAGGNLWYRWLLDHAVAFQSEGASLPDVAFVFAAPYRWLQQRIVLPNGLSIPAREPDLDPHAIAAALPGRLVVVAAERDATVPADHALFPEALVQRGEVVQHTIEGTDHRSVCGHPNSRQLVLDYLRGRPARL